MNPLVGWGLGGPCVRPRPPGGVGARLGQPAWSPSQLLRDLELRLGVSQGEASAAVRVPMYSRRLAALASATGNPFYARSFATDSLGTAKALLEWRDGLIEAGWRIAPAYASDASAVALRPADLKARLKAVGDGEMRGRLGRAA